MSHRSACVKTNGFKASDLSMPRAGSVIKQFVSRHQITSWACFKTNGFRASDQSDALMHGMQLQLSHELGVIKNSGFKASGPHVPRVGHILKPMVLRRQIRPTCQHSSVPQAGN